jgi:hypothetical protein
MCAQLLVAPVSLPLVDPAASGAKDGRIDSIQEELGEPMGAAGGSNSVVACRRGKPFLAPPLATVPAGSPQAQAEASVSAVATGAAQPSQADEAAVSPCPGGNRVSEDGERPVMLGD